MSQGPSITNVDDQKIVSLINSACQRVVLLTPGVTEEVAAAIVEAWGRLGGRAVSVILDVDPEVCRLGYGTVEAIQLLRHAAAKAGTQVWHQTGVRVGLLICDQTTLVFSPPPLLIEAGSPQPDRPNAVQLEDVPAGLAADVGLGPRPDRERRVGLDPVEPSDIEKVARELANAPPVRFDLARRVRVFTTRFQFVELEMTGCYVSRKKVPIPGWLIGLARNHEIESRFHAQFSLLDGEKLSVPAGEGRSITERSLGELRRAIVRDYLIPLKGYGSVVLRAEKQDLIDAVAGLTADVAAFEKGVRTALEDHVESNVRGLVEAILPAVRENLPRKYGKFLGQQATADQVRPLLEDDIRGAFSQAGGIVPKMEVSLLFKDVAYESLVDERFLKIAQKAIPNLELLHDAFDAAEAVPEQPRR